MTQSEKARGATTTEWDVCALSDISEKIMVGIASAATHAYRSKGVPLLRNQNIGAGWLDDSDVLFVDPEYERVFRNKRLRAGDLLTARTGYPGLTCVVPDAYEDAQSFTTLITRPDPQAVDSNYLAAYINSSRGQQFFNQSQIGGAQKNVNAATLRGMPIPLPQLNEQQAIAGALSDVDALLAGLDRLIAKKRDLKQAAMQQLLTGQTRLPGFGENWETCRLGRIAEMSSGGTPNSSVAGYYGGNIPWVSISDMTVAGKLISETERSLTSSGLANSAAQMFPAGTVLYAMYASLGECSIAAVPLCTSQAILGIRPKNVLNSDFLYYYLSALKPLVRRLGQQGTQANLSKAIVEDFPITLPNLSEQSAIVSVLSCMDLELDALQTRRDKTNNLKQAMMQELLTGRIRLI